MPRFSTLTYSVFAALLAYGLVIFTFGPCLTAMSDTFGVPLGRLGLIFTCFSLGVMPSVLFCGFLSEVVGRKRIFLGALALMAAACALFAAVPSIGQRPSFPLLLGVSLLLGLAGGGIETQTNALVADENRPSPGFALNLMHAFFAVGAVAGPLFASLLLRAGLPWQLAFYAGAAALGLMVFVLLPQRMPAPEGVPFTAGAAVAILRSPLLWLFLALMSLYVGAEVGVNAWVSPMLETELGAPRELAALAVSVFWLFMIVGRIAVSPAAARFRPVALNFGLAVGSCAAGLALALSKSPAAGLAAAAASGLFMSGIFGLTVTHATHYFAERMGAALGLMLTGVGLGPLLVPAVMGGIADLAGLRFAMLVPVGLMVGVAALCLHLGALRQTGKGVGDTSGNPV